MKPKTRSVQQRGYRTEAASQPTPLVVRRVCDLLERAYASPRHGNPTDPLDVLVYILLSNRTAPKVAQQTYGEMKRAYPNWEALSGARPREVERLLRASGLSRKRAASFRAIARRLAHDFGSVTLKPLGSWSDSEAEAYLCSLPGVSAKVAKCVLLYAWGRRVLPVDAHVHRITLRLGWHGRKRADQCHEALETLVPPALRYGFHVNCVAHGREVCRPHRPRCERCVLSKYCSYFQVRKQMETEAA